MSERPAHHRVEVVPVKLEPHPNADTLSIVHIRGFTCCVRSADWADGQLAAYIPPDSVVPGDDPQFAFLDGKTRIKVKKLRGIVSMGLLVPAPDGAQVGDDVADTLRITHYEPPLSVSSGGEAEQPPPGYHPQYDVDSMRSYPDIFVPGEEVVATEKIHGASARYCFHDGRMYCGSRAEWKKYDAKNIWWMALENTPELEQFCREHPEFTVYGEVFGKVQSLKYGADAIRFGAFDVLHGSEWLSWHETLGCALPWVPVVYRGPFDMGELERLADGPSLIAGADHIREGIVVKPVVERTHPAIGRVQLKLVSNEYLARC